MPIKIPNGLPAAQTLKSENIFVMDETRAHTQDIRPLRIGLLNLMPTKIATETQLARLLSNTPLQVELELIAVDNHVPKNTPAEHMIAFYKHFSDIKDQNFDGFIITGDTIFAQGFGRYDLYGGDAVTLKKSLNSLKELDPSLTLYSGHGESARLGQALCAISYFTD